MLIITWLEKPITGNVDVIDWSLLSKDGYQSGIHHKCVGPKDGEYVAKCDLKVSNNHVELDYRPYPDSRIIPGVVRIVFSTAMRDSVERVEWQDHGSEIWELCSVDISEGYIENVAGEPDNRRARVVRTVLDRPDQQRLKNELMIAYSGCCSVTGCNVQAVLEAAHINPVRNDGNDSVSNAILLRSDIHRLFDRGLISINKNLDVILSERLHNSQYEDELKGRKFIAPAKINNHPSSDLLERHRRHFGFPE